MTNASADIRGRVRNRTEGGAFIWRLGAPSMCDYKVLVVEDEPLLRLLVEEILQEAGFSTHVVGDAEAALAWMEKGVRPLALVTDIRLGAGRSGWDLARTLRERHPDIPVIYMSGDSWQDWPAKGVPGSLMISKPFVAVQISTGLAGLLNEAPPPE